MTTLDIAVSSASTTTGPGTGSGTLYHGPWRHEKQTLTAQYIRVPRASSQASHTLNLSAYTPTVPIGTSYLNFIIQAEYEIAKTTIGYTVSTPHVQPQTFSLQPASAGPEGTAYYPLPNAVSGHFGPAGQIITTSAFEDRRMWQTSDDGTEVHQTCQGANFIFHTSGTNFNWPILQNWTSYEAGFISPGDKYNPRSFMGGKPFLFSRLGHYYNLYGPYTTTKEIYGSVFVGQMIDYLARWVAAEDLTVLNPIYSASSLDSRDISEGCSLYSKSRHDYS